MSGPQPAEFLKDILLQLPERAAQLVELLDRCCHPGQDRIAILHDGADGHGEVYFLADFSTARTVLSARCW